MEVKRQTAFRAPLRLLSSKGVPITGQTFSTVTCYIQKQGQAPVLKTLTSSDWFELDSARFPGIYDLLLSQSDTDTVGFLKYSVAAPGTTIHVGVLGINRNTAGDIADLIGKPLSTLSRDILEVGNIVTTIGKHWRDRR